MKNILSASLLTILLSVSTTVFSQEKQSVGIDEKNKNQQRYFDINKNIDIYSNVLRELDLFYVDSLNLTKTARVGIDNMLKSLDPYTEYYNEDDMKDFTIMTTGEYAGVGASIAYKDSMITITDLFEGMPADKAGLKIGDAILSIDGQDMTVCEKEEGQVYGQALSRFVSTSLKGQPGSVIAIKVQRPGEKKPLEYKVTREKIVMEAVPYYGLVASNVGYIALSTFTDKSASEVKIALQELETQGITSLVLDLRQNGGGILEQAIQIVNLFVPRGKEVLSTKGKIKQWDRIYRTTLDAIDADIPLVVLVDRGSASASEIVAGALQDMDRAVLVGERTFGKGLVQATREIPYGGSLKVTMSKYYIPSGRCVQAIDYSHRNSDGSVGRIPDSLTTVFRTAAGRPVRDGGGVSPDIALEDEKLVSISLYMENQYIIFDWVTKWMENRKTIGEPNKFTISDADYEDFKTFVKSKDFKYDMLSDKNLKSLKEIMEFEGYLDTASEEIKALEAKLVPDLNRDLDTFKENIMKHINSEIVKRYYYKKGEYAYTLTIDNGVEKAVEVLNDQNRYNKILSAPQQEDQPN